MVEAAGPKEEGGGAGPTKFLTISFLVIFFGVDHLFFRK
jgi:hypothetical protein